MGRLIEFAPAPGIVKDLTTNAATGNWVDCDKVRFRKGFPEKIGGWVRYTTEAFVGICRSLFTWVTLDHVILTAVGTHLKYYVEDNGELTDITPIRRSLTLGGNPLTTGTIGTGIVTVTDTSHGAVAGDYVTISGATTWDGITSGQINKEHTVLTIVNANSYTINTGGVATAGSTAGGGASVVAAYQLNIGAANTVFGSGWGAGAWGHTGGWGSEATVSLVTSQIRIWTQDNFGEDLLFCPRYGQIYRYDSSSGGRGALISAEGGASDVPTTVTEIMVAPNQRIVIAFGCNAIGSSNHDELLIRWTDYEDYLNWTPDTDNAAGGFRLTSGSRIVTALRGRQEILVWTDTSLFGLQFDGSQGGDTFQSYLIDPNVSITGPLAKTSLGGVVYWMGDNSFYTYDGRVQTLGCPIEDYVFGDFNINNKTKVVAGTNAKFDEIWFIYPAEGSSEPDRYVVYNVGERLWYHGTLDRTFWLDRGTYDYPRAASTDGYVYTHEFGLDDGSTDPVSAISSYVESAPVEIGGGEDMGRGDRFVFVNRMIPDVTFRESTASAPTLTYTFKQRNYPGQAYSTESASIDKGATVDQYTNKKSIRLRARALALKIANDEVGADWRIGVHRFETRTDGRKA